MGTVNTLVITGYGTNSHMETAHTARLAGADKADVVHFSDLVAAKDAAAIVAGCTKANNCSGTIDTGRFASMSFRGTPNSWAATAMTVDSSQRIWSTMVNFTGKGDGSGAQRFKFDVYGNWSENYGDTNADGIAEKCPEHRGNCAQKRQLEPARPSGEHHREQEDVRGYREERARDE